MLEKYATEAIALDGPSAERPFDYSMNLPIERHFPGSIAFIGFLKQLTGEIEPDHQLHFALNCSQNLPDG